MPNYNENQYNTFLDNCDALYNYLSGNDNIERDFLELNDFSRDEVSPYFVQICEYRKLSNDSATFERIKSGMQHELAYYQERNLPVAYYLIYDGTSVKLYIATAIDDFDDGFDRRTYFIPDVITRTGTFINQNELKNYSQFGGVVTGNFDIENPSIDSIIQSMFSNNAKKIAAFIAYPISDVESNRYKDALIDMRDYARQFSNVNYNVGRTMSVHGSFPMCDRLLAFLNDYYERLSANNDLLWKISLWYASDNEYAAENLGRSICSVLSASSKSGRVGTEKLRNFHIGMTPFLKGIPIAMSEAVYVDERLYEYISGSAEWYSLLKGTLYSICTNKELASIMQLPLHGHIGIDVVDLGIDSGISSDRVSYFRRTVPNVDINGAICLGVDYATGQKYYLPVNYLAKNIFISGAPGGGKSNTTWNIIESLNSEGIPFCIFETAKNEYWHLSGEIKDLKVYSFGNDARPLRFNPLVPELGTIISDHISLVETAFKCAFDSETVVNLEFKKLLIFTYKKYGWNENDIYFETTGQKKIPSINDLYKCLTEYVNKEMRGGADIKQDIMGALDRRVYDLIHGVMGRLTNVNQFSSCGTVVSAEELCNAKVLIEFDSLADVDMKAFTTYLLLFKMRNYIKKRDSAFGALRNLIIIEEAHNVLKQDNSQLSGSRNAAEDMICNMLLEMRDYGTGLMIIDQRASKVDSTVIAASKVKIAHVLTESEDMSKALGGMLTDGQRAYLPRINDGEALIGIQGDRQGVSRVKINKAMMCKDVDNIGCIFCKKASICHQESTIMELGKYDDKMFINRLCGNRYDSVAIQSITDSYFDSINLRRNYRVCALGYILAKANRAKVIDQMECRRILYNYIYGVN